jgi:hypothetical protein
LEFNRFAINPIKSGVGEENKAASKI